MTGPRDDAGKPGQKLGGWEPLVCSSCGWQSTDPNPAAAVEQLEQHLTDEHGVEL